MSEPDWGVFYENDAPVLRGDRLCGGPMDFQAASDAGGRPSQQVSVTGPSVEGFYRALGARTRCASISSNARPQSPPSVPLPRFSWPFSPFLFTPYNWLRDLFGCFRVRGVLCSLAALCPGSREFDYYSRWPLSWPRSCLFKALPRMIPMMCR
jgi:hypothetical protein